MCINRRLLAGIVVVAVVVTVVLVGRLVLQRTPAGNHTQGQPSPSPHYLAFPTPSSGTFCSGDRARHWATSPPTTAKMVDATTGWAYGPLRTTDGGAHWMDVSPPSITGRTPINNEYFLDATHAWVAETAGTATTCVDHIVTFSTSDAGRTWQQAAPIPVRYAEATDYIWTPPARTNWFSFLDAQNGWLLVGSGPAVATQRDSWPGFGQRWRVGELYRTGDGGLHWAHVATNPGLVEGCQFGLGMSFSSATTGWVVADCGLVVTRDGGATWHRQQVPVTVASPPKFFDDRHGVLLGVQGLLVTPDAGATWELRPFPGASFIDFISPNEGWAVRFIGNDPNQAEYGLYHTADGGKTWDLVTANTLPPVPPATYWRTKGEDAGWGLDFVDSKTGFWTICGGPQGPCIGSGLYKTTDGGATWSEIREAA